MLKTIIKDGKTYAPLSELKPWEKNPRGIKKDDFERLKRQITQLGQYKPLIVTKDGTVLGGNMRIRAYTELGIEEVWVSVVDAPTERRKAEIALSDNDRVGYYEDDKLAELIQSIPEINLEDFKVDLGQAISIGDVLERFGPGPEEIEAPEPPENPVSKLGEIYQLGRHKLGCMDSTVKENVEKL